MSLKGVFTSILHLFIVCSYFFGATLFLLLPYSSFGINFVEKAPQIGLVLLGVAFLLLFSFYLLRRGKYLVIKMGVTVDTKAIYHSIQECFLKEFSNQIALSDVDVFRKTRLRIEATYLSKDHHEKIELLKRAEKELTCLLRNRFGYTKPFYFTLKS